ncbi:MAG: AtpZ/AtpI family protein [Salinimicrobium sp.]
MKEEKNDKKNQLRNWAVFSGIAFQMGATIFICAWIGKKLDERYPSGKSWFTMGFVLFGLLVSVYVVLKQLKRFNK